MEVEVDWYTPPLPQQKKKLKIKTGNKLNFFKTKNLKTWRPTFTTGFQIMRLKTLFGGSFYIMRNVDATEEWQ